MGPKRLHGPHQSAQKSTRTMSLSVMVSSKLSPLMLIVAMLLLVDGRLRPRARRGLLLQPHAHRGYSSPLRSDRSRLRSAAALLDRHDPPHRDGNLDHVPALELILEILDRPLYPGPARIRQIEGRH